MESFINSLTQGAVPPKQEVKAYLDCVYLNYFELGLSFLFVTKDGSRIAPQGDVLNNSMLILDSVDVFNPDPNMNKVTSQERSYSAYPALPITISLREVKPGETSRPSELILDNSSTGKDIVATLGEPDRKGGGAGPSHGSIGIWCEWSKDGIMIEFGGPGSKGPDAWDKGKDALWRILTVFRPKSG